EPRMVPPMGRSLPMLLCAGALACETRLILVDPPPSACTPGNCTGCCDAHNVCVGGEASQRDDQCGTKGSACMECAPGTHCTNGECVVPPRCGTCSGCCVLSLDCAPGTRDDECGKAGEQCESCSVNHEHCIGGTCVRCGPSNCTGCCDF